jgi:hypothetical protein
VHLFAHGFGYPDASFLDNVHFVPDIAFPENHLSAVPGLSVFGKQIFFHIFLRFSSVFQSNVPFPALYMQEVQMKHAITACLICIILTGCVPLEDPRPFSPGDLRPPSYLGLKQDDDVSLTLRFSESVTAVSGETAVSASDGSPIPIEGMDDGAAQVSLRLAAAPEPGERCVITIRVADSGGNSLRALIPFYGLNTSLPPIIISEFTTQGSSTSPDMVELLVLEAGNTAGAVLCEGVDGDAIQKMVHGDDPHPGHPRRN